MKIFSSKKQIFLISLLPLSFILTQLSKLFSNFTEQFYSSFFYKIIANALSSLTGFLPFSLSELIIIFFVSFTLFYILKTIFKLYRCKSKRSNVLINFFLNILATLGLIYFSFQFLWGFNYQRLTADKIFQLNIHKSSSDELFSLCQSLINSSNTLREKVNKNHYGIMSIPYNKKHILAIASLGYDKASLKYTKLKGSYAEPKAIFLSTLMCYTGITGFYFPFTNEANVNMKQPDSSLPFTIVHEMAHQRGFAKENEANYISYIVCTLHPDINFKYSGTLSALSYSLNALRKSNPQKYKKLIFTCSKGVLNDLKYNQNFWDKYSGSVEKVSDKINDAYLKSQNQQSGTKSYGEMVDLLLADYRKK